MTYVNILANKIIDIYLGSGFLKRYKIDYLTNSERLLPGISDTPSRSYYRRSS